MTTYFPKTETPSQRRRLVTETMQRLGTTKPDRVLSALGHPNYSEAWAARCILDWIEKGGTLHRFVYAPVTPAKASLSVWKQGIGRP